MKHTHLPQVRNNSIDVALAGLLRGDDWSLAYSSMENSDQILRRAEFHGIAGLLIHDASDRLPPMISDSLKQIAVAQAFWDAQHARIIRPLIEALAQCGTAPLIFKGTALAYTWYASPGMRQRGDTDILVKESAFKEACNVIRSFGFSAPISGLSQMALGARVFSLDDGRGGEHAIDLHLRINDSPIIANLFPHDELQSRSESVLALGPSAKGVGWADALLIACFHRLVHLRSPYHVDGISYLSSDRLIWLNDIKLLHRHLDGRKINQILDLAATKGLSRVLKDGLRATDHWLGLGASGLIAGLEPTTQRELPYQYLRSGLGRRWVLNIVASESFAAKGRAVLDLLIPPRAYMSAKYGNAAFIALPLLYIWRAFFGLYKVARRSIADPL